MVDKLVDDQLAVNNVVEKGFRILAELANVRVLSHHFVSNTDPVALIGERIQKFRSGFLQNLQKALRRHYVWQPT